MTLTDLRFFLLRLGSNRNLLRNLVLRDLKNRYVGSVGGFFWSIVHPVVLLVSYHFVFSQVLAQRIGIEEFGTDSFALYLFSGILPWLMFSDTIQRNCSAVTDNANLVTRTVIPSEILPISMMLSNLIHHLIGLVILVGVVIATGNLDLGVFQILVYLPILVFLSQGIGWLVAALNVFSRDTGHVLTVLLVLWFWFTPVFYPPSMVPERFSFILELNPMAALLAGYRSAFLASAPPSPGSLAVLLSWTVAAFLGGALFFRRSKAAFADVL